MCRPGKAESKEQGRKGVTVYSRRELREDRVIKCHRGQKCIQKWCEQERIIAIARTRV